MVNIILKLPKSQKIKKSGIKKSLVLATLKLFIIITNKILHISSYHVIEITPCKIEDSYTQLRDDIKCIKSS
jgi:hypothetical protein